MGKVSKNRGFKVSEFRLVGTMLDRHLYSNTFSQFPFWAEKPVNVPASGV
jgi:hypothetical protein